MQLDGSSSSFEVMSYATKALKNDSGSNAMCRVRINFAEVCSLGMCGKHSVPVRRLYALCALVSADAMMVQGWMPCGWLIKRP